MGTTAEALATAVDDLLAVDPADLADEELHDLTVALQRQAHRCAALRARCVGTWDRRRLWEGDGSRSPGHRLARQASMSVPAAKTEVRRARALLSMPHTAAALADGAISAQHVDLLANANTGNRAQFFADHEETLVAQCRLLRFADAQRMIDYWIHHADADGGEDDAARQHEARHASAATTLDGMVDLRALFDPVGGATFLSELARLMERLRLDDEANGRIRTLAQRRADALVEMAIRSRSAHDGEKGRPRPLITILLGAESLDRLCELATGTVITPGQIVPLLSGADIEGVVFDGPGRVIKVTKKRRFTGAVRRAIEVRDRRCQHPSGCDEPADRCDVDHIRPRRDDGETSQENGRLGCWYHNRIEKFQHAEPPPPTSEPPPTDATSQEATDDERPDAPTDRSPPDGRAPPDTA